MKRLLAGALAYGIGALGIVSACTSAPEAAIAADGKPRAKIASGVVAGEMVDGVATWKGVPYAAAPVGELRWKAPRPVAAWPGERAADAYGPSCSQNSRLGAEARVSEDCLYLNVYAPQGAKNTPVMVWIHGGSNLNGSGSVYNGAAFAKSGVVMVTVNYRMGALGFFAHPELTSGSALATAPVQSEEDKAMAALMHSCWVAFARTGEPKCASGPAWPKYDAKSDQLMEFGAPSGVRTNFRKAAMDKWQAEEKNAK